MLSIVGTPIGNLGDLTYRAADTLRACDLIAAEDTRHAGILLAHYQIKKPLISYHEHNEAQRTAELIPRLREENLHLALVSDAGMPTINDPGGRLIAACVAEGLALEVIPGVSALTTALAGAGLPTAEVYFGGFLPNTSGRRENVLRQAVELGITAIFFESPHRIERTLAVLAEIAPGSKVCVARELTKKFEEFRRGTPAEVLAHYQAKPPKGEITFLVNAAPEKKPEKVDKYAKREN
jgi:16S rRNA (cytidine1402-2'-O)-methyltransferase